MGRGVHLDGLRLLWHERNLLIGGRNGPRDDPSPPYLRLSATTAVKTVLVRGGASRATSTQPAQQLPLHVLAQLRRGVVHAQLLVRPSLGAGGVALPQQALDPLPEFGDLHVPTMENPPNLIGALFLVLLPRCRSGGRGPANPHTRGAP